MSLILLLLACFRTKGEVCRDEFDGEGDTNNQDSFSARIWSDGRWGASTGWLDISVALHSATACAINTDRLLCWGENDLEVLGQFASVETGPRHVCAITGGGDLSCRTYAGGDDAVTAVPSGQWRQVALEEDFACARPVGSGLVCWGDTHSLEEEDRPYLDLAVITPSEEGAPFLCAVSSDQELRCWTADNVGETPLAVDVMEVELTSVGYCTLSSAGRISCVSPYYPAWEGRLPGRYDELAAGSNICGLSANGNVNCADYPDAIGDCVIAGRRFKALDVGSMSCVLNAEGRIGCWGWDQEARGNLPPP